MPERSGRTSLSQKGSYEFYRSRYIEYACVEVEFVSHPVVSGVRLGASDTDRSVAALGLPVGRDVSSASHGHPTDILLFRSVDMVGNFGAAVWS